MKKIFVINGSGGVGKDTFVQLVSDYLRKINNQPMVINVSSIDKIKGIAIEAGWKGGKQDKDRKFLSDLNKLCNQYSDLSFNYMRKQVESFMKSRLQILFLHIREPENIERAVREFNAETILIRRDVPKITTNDSDLYVDSYEYDYIINNDGTLHDLEISAKMFIDNYRSECMKRKELIKLRFNEIKGITEFVNKGNKMQSDITIYSNNRYIVDGKSIMGLFSLNLSEPVRMDFLEKKHGEKDEFIKFCEKMGLMVD